MVDYELSRREFGSAPLYDLARVVLWGAYKFCENLDLTSIVERRGLLVGSKDNSSIDVLCYVPEESPVLDRRAFLCFRSKD
ncbi:hypothetical protein J4467_03170 [Candidatus Woesearchaeota archaeon]|nr:hypothetical protein [Candidatus Woesearchaeota archaeon]